MHVTNMTKAEPVKYSVLSRAESASTPVAQSCRMVSAVAACRDYAANAIALQVAVVKVRTSCDCIRCSH